MPEVLAALGEAGSVVVEAPPGAGKTTRVPPAIDKAGLASGEILVVEPRRMAARLSARRVASERGERVGASVGYRVRFDEAAGAATRICYVTEGILLRRLAEDPQLAGVGAVIFDEVHERHLAADLAMALCKRLRPRIKLAAMSATVDADAMAAWMDAPVVRSEGRRFEVALEYLPQPSEKPLESEVAAALRKLVRDGLDGDVLVFLPGAAEIRKAGAACAPVADAAGIDLVTLHGDLPADEQDRAVQPGPRRKLILSTNVAETSITVEGVVAVIDSGLARVATHSPWTGLPSLRVQRIARAAAAQRAGRAGRVRAGRCVRLYTRHDHDTRPAQETPEVQRADLAEALLLLHSVGQRDAAGFDWLEAPSQASLSVAERLLERLGAVESGELTAIGRRLLKIPAHPRHARMLVEAEARGVVRETALAAALLSEGPLLHASRRGPAKISGPSDVLDEMERFEEARRVRFDGDRLRNLGIDVGAATSADRVRRQLEATVRPRAARPPNGDSLDAAIGMCVLAGYPDRVARRVRADQLLLAGGTTAALAPSSVVRSAPLLVALDAESRTGGGARGQVLVRLAQAIEPEWLAEVAASALVDETRVAWENNRAVVVQSEIYDGLVLEERRRPPSTPEERRRATELVLVAARERLGLGEPPDAGPEADDEEGGVEVDDEIPELGDERVGLLLRRVAFVRAARPNLELPPLGAAEVDAALRALVGDATVLAHVALDGSALAELLLDGIGGANRRLLDELAPERVTLPSGRRAVIEYPPPPAKPWLASRIQDFFGWKSGPTVAGAPLVLHLLAPNRRAVQVTADLASFWERHYPSLRRQLSRRYPRHAWPQDPTVNPAASPAVRPPPSTKK